MRRVKEFLFGKVQGKPGYKSKAALEIALFVHSALCLSYVYLNDIDYL